MKSALLLLLFSYSATVTLAQQNEQKIINGRAVIASTVVQGGLNPQPGIGPGWQKILPLRQSNDPRLGRLLNDIESQLQPNHGYRDNDRITWAHEATHGINSRAREALPPHYNAFYCFYGKIFVAPEPHFSKQHVAQFIPQHLRHLCESYDLYINEPKPPPGYESWHNSPLHLIDEYTAYLNGLDVAQECGIRVSPDSDLRHAVEFALYSSAFLRCLEHYDRNYKHTAELTNYLNLCLARTGHYIPTTPNAQIKSFAQAIKQAFGGTNYEPIYTIGNGGGRVNIR